MDSLTVTISSPNQSPHKFALTLSRKCSMLELKEIIAARLDTRPAIADQRLIFGGRILDDKDTIDQVFEKVDCSDSSPTIHLVVSQRQPTTTPTTPSPLRFRFDSDSTAPAPPLTSTWTAMTGERNLSATTGTNLNTRHSFAPFSTAATNQGSRTENTPGTTGSSANSTADAAATTESPFTAGLNPVLSAPIHAAQSPLHQPMQYVIVNGMPYLVPAVYLPILQHQHYLQQAQLFSPYMYYGAPVSTNLDGTTFFYPPPHAMMGDQAQAAPRAGPGAAAGAADPNAQDIVARDQRRAASLWLLMKLAFGVYVFSQNGSIERIVLLHIAALVIFLHQTGRLRIVRRIGNPPGDAPQEPVVNAGQHAPAVNGQARASATTSTSTATSTTSSDGTHVNNSNPMNDQQGQSSSSTSVHGSNGLTAAGSSSHSQPAQNPAAASAGTSAASLDGSNAPGAQTQQAHDTTQQQPQPRVSTWRSIEHALLTFVTSLVPAPPPEIDQAVANAAAGDRGL